MYAIFLCGKDYSQVDSRYCQILCKLFFEKKKTNSWQPSSCALFLSQMYILYNSVLAQRMCSCISISFTQLHLVRFGLFFFLILCEFVLFHFIFCFVSTFAIIRSFRVHSLQRKTLFFAAFVCERTMKMKQQTSERASERTYVRQIDSAGWCWVQFSA